MGDAGHAEPANGARRRAAELLAMLRGARGRPVPWATLHQALGCCRSALNDYANLLRFDGHDVVLVWGMGLALRPPGEAEARPEPEVAAALAEAARRPSPRKERRCLGGCGKLFKSEHAGNRICGACSKLNRGALAETFAMARP